MRLILLLFIVCFYALHLRAQQADSAGYGHRDARDEAFPPDDDHTTSPGDGDSVRRMRRPEQLWTSGNYKSEHTDIRQFDENKWKAVIGNADFQETPQKENQTNSSPSYSLPWAGALLKLVSYIAIIGIVIFLLYLVLRNVSIDLKMKRSEVKKSSAEKAVENIEDVDIYGLLEQARSEGNFRMAVRLYYLGLLKKLHELGVIAWKKDKTNRDYLAELFSKDFYFQEVQRLTVSYEAVWYGEHNLNAASFQHLSSRFEFVLQEIDRTQTP